MNDKTTVTPAGVIRAAAFELAADRVRVDLERYKREGQTSIQKMVEAVFARQTLEPLAAELEAWSNDELTGEAHTSKPRPRAPEPRPTISQAIREAFTRPLSPRDVVAFSAGTWLMSLLSALFERML